MLKRFYSKKSGFTLVEIIIAFAVFSVMASMIVQILDLSVQARRYNIEFQNQLDIMERSLTLVEKDGSDYTDHSGDIHLDFVDGPSFSLDYEMKSMKSSEDAVGGDLIYFVSPVDYADTGFGAGGDTGYVPDEGTGSGGGSSTGSNTGSQMQRLDTRLTGTANIGSITVIKVIKDTHVCTDSCAASHVPVPDGCTRYYFMVGADGSTVNDEDVPFAQYRMFFYYMPKDADDTSYLDTLESSKVYTETDEYGNTVKYKKDVSKEAIVANIGYVQTITDSIGESGLAYSNVMTGYDNNYNRFSITQSGTNGVRIGTPFVSDDWVTRGRRFSATSKFYVDFVGDPNLTVESFGANGEPNFDVTGAYSYGALPEYVYDSDGNANYDDYDGYHVNIYGAYLYTKHYVDGSDED